MTYYFALELSVIFEIKNFPGKKNSFKISNRNIEKRHYVQSRNKDTRMNSSEVALVYLRINLNKLSRLFESISWSSLSKINVWLLHYLATSAHCFLLVWRNLIFTLAIKKNENAKTKIKWCTFLPCSNLSCSISSLCFMFFYFNNSLVTLNAHSTW